MYKIEFLDIEENDEFEKTISKVLEECFKVENLPEDKLLVVLHLQIQKILENLIVNIEILIRQQMFYLFLCLKKKKLIAWLKMQFGIITIF